LQVSGLIRLEFLATTGKKAHPKVEYNCIMMFVVGGNFILLNTYMVLKRLIVEGGA
jgi:hypothetical protein